MPKVHIRTGGKELNIKAETGERLLDVLRRTEVNVTAPCGGLGRCGKCPFRHSCGGSRSRAYALTGDFLAEEPDCDFDV